MISMTKRVAPSINPVIHVTSAAILVTLLKQIPQRKMAAIGGDV